MRLAAFLALCVLTGCAGTFELVYEDRFDLQSRDRAPTSESVQRMEYRSAEHGDALECYDTRRSVMRERSVTKTYRRRGGLSGSIYGGAIAGDAIGAGLIGGPVLAMCLRDEPVLSCWHLLWAAPYLIDALYAAIRLPSAQDAVLIDKQMSGDRAVLGDIPQSQEETSCELMREVRLGQASSTGAEGLAEGSLPVALDAERRLIFSAEILDRWAESSSLALYVVAHDGSATRIRGPQRCKAIVHHRSSVPYQERSAALREACPPPKTPSSDP